MLGLAFTEVDGVANTEWQADACGGERAQLGSGCLVVNVLCGLRLEQIDTC